MAGIRDVAKRANVSISTVSLVLNNNGYVSAETRANVLKAMKELKYVPNELARNLYHNRTNIVGIILPDILHPFFGTFAKYAEMELHKKGFKTMLCSTVRKDNGEKEYIDMLKRQMMDGIIMGTHTLDIQEYEELDKPIVSLDRYINDKIPIVRSNHLKGGHLAAMQFIECGCKNVLQFKGDIRVKTPAHEYHTSCAQTLKEHGVNVHIFHFPWNKWDFETFDKQVQAALKKCPQIDGIFGPDLIALAALKRAKEYHKQVPEELKLISYDGTIVTSMYPIEITSVCQNIELLAKTSVDLLVQQINGKQLKKTEYILDIELKKRDTT